MKKLGRKKLLIEYAKTNSILEELYFKLGFYFSENRYR